MLPGWVSACEIHPGHSTPRAVRRIGHVRRTPMRGTTVVLMALFALGAAARPADAACLSTLTVAKDGTGNFTTVQAAVNAVPDGTATTIMIKPGLYREVVTVPAAKSHLTFLGTTGNPADVTI